MSLPPLAAAPVAPGPAQATQAAGAGPAAPPLRVLSVIAPMTQLNTPYPSTAYLTGFLRSRGIAAQQEDLALALALALLSAEGLDALRAAAEAQPPRQRTPRVAFFLANFARYRSAIGPAVGFLQGRDGTLAQRIAGREFLPEGERFRSLEVYDDPEGGDPMAWAFGALGQTDRAKHLATLFLNDIADVVKDAADPRFEFVRYAESLARSQASFEPLAQALAAPPTLVDRLLEDLALAAVERHRPGLVLLSVPFPGAVYAALRIAQTIKARHPQITLALGGGYVNTELRELAEPRLFDHVDIVTLDAGERPVLALIEHLQGQRGPQRLVRSFRRSADGQRVDYINWPEPDIPFEDTGTPTWDGLPLQR